MTKVYITNRGAHNYSDAERFGQLVYCTEGSIPKFDTAQMVRECEQAMEDSHPKDFILLTSLTSLCSIACSVFAVKHGRLNLLIYKGNGYVEREVVLTTR